MHFKNILYGEMNAMHKKDKRKLLILVPILFLMVMAILLIRKEKLHLSYLDYFTGNAAVLKPDGNIEPAEIRKKLFNKDRVITYDESKAYIQLDSNHLVELDPNSELDMESFTENIDSPDGDTILDFIKGKIKAYAKKLLQKGEFKIKAGKYVVNIRDAIFSIEKNADILKIEIKAGSLSITPEAGGEETILSAGEKALITGNNITKEKMTGDSLPAFENINRLRPIIDIQTASKEYIIEYFRIKAIQGENSLAEKEEPVKPDRTLPSDNKNKQKINESDKTHGVTRLNVNSLTANGIEKNEAADISKIIYSRLVSSKGKDKVIYRLADGNSKGANRQLTGRVSRLGSVKIVSVNVLDVESGKVLFNKTVKINESDQMQSVLEGMADKIVSTGEIW